MPGSLHQSVRSIDADSIMALLPIRPRLLAVGEPTHGVESLLELRNRIFRDLVEHEQYRIIALETDCVRGLIVDDFVTSGVGFIDDVMTNGFSHDWGRLEGNRELVRWMREFNVGRSESETIHFAGFDGPLEMSAADSPRGVLVELHTYLARWVGAELLPITAEDLDRVLGEDAQWTEPQAMMDPSKAAGRNAEAVELRLLADDLVSLLETQLPHLLTATSRREVNRARLYARTAVDLLRYHYWMADPSPARMARLCGLRDSMMASNLLSLADQAPTLVYAHSSHLQRQQSSMQMWQGPIEWWSAGALVSSRLHEEYAFLPTALGTIEDHDVGVPSASTIEGLLYSARGNAFLVDTRSLSALDELPTKSRVSPWFGYAPLDPAHLADTDGLLFVKDVS